MLVLKENGDCILAFHFTNEKPESESSYDFHKFPQTVGCKVWVKLRCPVSLFLCHYCESLQPPLTISLGNHTYLEDFMLIIIWLHQDTHWSSNTLLKFKEDMWKAGTRIIVLFFNLWCYLQEE